ncbi:3D domain-containing protein [Ectobacillus sp. JY-23]|uniref:3D domain-containing protein n=1 Tax=Ectobacillus sp. JY-23 TaxID=2933872 RepID=UPI001FF1ACD7|nr:3D domain-containing protein [Ectobacillus sp. JY-23]UOY92858.1 3D domain-containing protein [Ectobacillus sp. JY-23]
MRIVKRFMSIQMIPPLLVAAGFGGTTVSVHNQYQKAKQQHQEVQTDMQTKNEALQMKVKELEQQTQQMQGTVQQKDAQLQQMQQKLQETEQKMTEAGAAVPSRSNDEVAAARTIQVRATAYSADPAENGGTYNGKVLTKTGFSLTDNPTAKVIAVDPRVIPLGSTVWVEGYGYAKALDTGSAIKGNKIDVFIHDKNKGRQWGVRTVEVRIIKEGP